MGMSQILMIIILGTNLLLGAHLHGKPKTGDYDFGVTIISVLIFTFILYFGGFFG